VPYQHSRLIKNKGLKNKAALAKVAMLWLVRRVFFSKGGHMATYKIETSNVLVAGTPATMIKVGFGDPAQNDQIVRDVESRMKELFPAEGDNGGSLALVNGPASLPVAVVLTHHLAHRFAAIGVFDPKMAAYIVATSHGGDYAVGDVIPAAEVKEA
jgi:CRISPR-associated protein Csx3